MYKAILIQTPKAGKLNPPPEAFQINNISFTAKTEEELIKIIDMMIGKFKIYKMNFLNKSYELIRIQSAKGLCKEVDYDDLLKQ